MRRTKAKDRLADMIEEALDARVEDLTEYCEKNRLSYEVDIRIWKWGEKPEGGQIARAHEALEELGVALSDAGHTWTPKQRKAWEKADRLLRVLL
jgi:ribosome biogenesis protein Nip4